MLAREHVLLFLLLGAISIGSVSSVSLLTSFSNSTVRKGGFVELVLTSFNVGTLSLASLTCGYQAEDLRFNSLAFYSNIISSLRISSVIPNRFLGRVSVRDKYAIVIQNLTFEDEGLPFFCQMLYFTLDGEPKTVYGQRHTIISIQDPPKIINTALAEKYAVNEGETANLTCSFVSAPLSNITWTGRVADVGDRITTTLTSGRYTTVTTTLVLKNVKDVWNGEKISCAASVTLGGISQETYLDVRFTPRNTSLANTVPSVGENVTIRCQADANPPVSFFTLFKDGSLLAISPTGSYTLFSLDCTTSTGNYSCVPTNPIGNGLIQTKFLQFYGLEVPLQNITVEVTQHGRVELFCNATGCPVTTYQWYRLGLLNIPTLSTKSNLIISNATEKDETTYTCLAGNGIKTGIQYFTLIVNVGSVISLFTASQPNACVGDRVTLVCTAIGKPLPRIQLLNSSTVLNEGYGVVSVTVTVSMESFGNYHCFAMNKISNNTRSFYLERREINGNESVVSSKDVTLQHDVTLYCLPLSCMTFQFRWYRGDSSVLIGVLPGLAIFNASLEDEDTYRCVASNGRNVGTFYRTLRVNVPPKITHLQSDVNDVCLGSKIIIKCNATGRPKPLVEIRKEGKTIASGSEETKREVTIAEDDFGTYICFASNRANNASSEIQIHRRAKASQPRDITISADSSQVTIEVNEPLCLPVRSNLYAVYIKRKDSSMFERFIFNCSTPRCSFCVKGLGSNQEYQVQVSNIGTNGSEGERSALVTTRTAKSTAPEIEEGNTTIVLAVVISVIVVLALVAGVVIFKWKKSKEGRQVLPGPSNETGANTDSRNKIGPL